MTTQENKVLVSSQQTKTAAATAEKIIGQAIEKFGMIGVAVVVIMVFYTTADVTLRYFFNKPIADVYELTGFMMLIVGCLTIAWCALTDQHVKVDILVKLLSPRLQNILMLLNNLLVSGVSLLMVVQTFKFGMYMLETGAHTTLIKMPYYPFYFIMAQFLPVVFAMLMMLIRSFYKVVKDDAELLGVIGIIAVIVALLMKFWLGAAFLAIGFLGYGLLEGWERAFTMVAMQSYSSMTKYDITVLPMFILMAALASNTGISGDLYHTSRAWLGQIRGGLAIATVAGCGMFAAISGSSMATSLAIGKAAFPELRKYGYDEKLAVGSIAAGGTVGNLIPPSMGFILYGILTETSVGKLFMAGILPGVLEVVVYIMIIYLICRIKPEMGPPGEKTSFMEKIVSLKNTWPMVTLFLLVMGGIYLGIFTPTEAGAVGAFGTIVITLIMRRLNLEKFLAAIKETAQTTGMLIMILVGVMILMRFFTISNLPAFLGNYVAGLQVSPMVIMGVIIIFYLLAGAFMDILAVIFITVPIFFPIVTGLGYHPLWFGVIIVMMFEIGAITPPMGLNVFVLSAATDLPVSTIFRGIIPFLVGDLIRVLLVVFIPAISLYIPLNM